MASSTDDVQNHTPPKDRNGMSFRGGIGLVISLALAFTAAALGGLATSTGAWYAELNKPSWNPPGWIFGPVWTVLYTAMAVAAWRVWKGAGWDRGRTALGVYGLQLAVNAAWSPVFFGAHLLWVALGIVALLVVLVAITIRHFWRHDRTAAMLLVPYLAWVSFATVLNGAIAFAN